MKIRPYLEIAVLIAVVIGIWVIVSLPLIFYHLPLNEVLLKLRPS